MAFVIFQIWPCLLATFSLGGLVAWFLNRSTANFAAKVDLPNLSAYARKIDLPAPPDLSRHALKSEIPDVTGFLTASALAPLALKSDIPDVRSFVTAAALAPLALKADITTPDLTSYAKKSDIPSMPDLSGFALKRDIPVVPPPPDLTGFAKLTDIPAPPDLSMHALKSDIPDVTGFLTASALAPLALKSDIPDVRGFVTAAALAPLALKSDITPLDLSGYLKRSELPDAPDLSRFALKSDLPLMPPPVDLSGFVTRTELPAVPDLSPFALRSELPPVPPPVDLSDFVRRGELPEAPDLSAFVRRHDLPAPPDLSGFALRSELSSAPDLSAFARLADVPARQDLSIFAERSELPDLTGVVRVRELETQLQERDRTIAELTEYLKAEGATRVSEIARLEGLLRDALERRPEPAKRPLERDNLEDVHGIGPVLAKRLNKLGVTTFAQIARWTDADIDTIEPRLDTIQGRIRREGWVPDSRRLHEEKYGEHIVVAATRQNEP